MSVPMLKESDVFSSFSVDDLQRAKEFYGGTLGLDVSDEGMGLELRLPGGGDIFVYPKPDHRPATFTILNFPVDSVERAVDELMEAGVRPEIYDEGGIETDERGIFVAHGRRMAWFEDPAGNVLSVVEETQA